MEQLMVCRICLATDVKLYEMCKYRLKSAYENLTGFDVTSASNPQYVCCYCGATLYKYDKFQARCHGSQRILEDLYQKHTMVTTNHVKSLNLQSYSIALPYTTNIIQNFDTSICVKDENDLTVKNNILNTENYDLNDDNYNNAYNLDIDKESIKSLELEPILCEENTNLIDSDEEPLAKKVKKKRKKTKKVTKNLATQAKCDKIEVKSEKNDDFMANDETYTFNDTSYSINDESYTTNDKNNPENDNHMSDLVTNHELTILSEEEQIKEVLERKMSSNYLNSFYKCDSCYKGFMTEATYKNHMARHDPSCGAVVCAVCATRWRDGRALRAHSLIAHQRRYTCKMCGHTSKTAHKAKEHYKWHTGVTFSCEKCNKTFEKSTSYLTHMRLRHASKVCDVCNMSFLGENGLNMHRKKAHTNKNTESTHECAHCLVGFRSAEALARHTDVTSGYCDNTMNVCKECGDHFASDKLLEEHTKEHEKNNAVRVCPQCSRRFAHERSLAAHVARVHPLANTRTHAHRVCELCGYTCMTAGSLLNHQRIHSGEKPHACSLCEKTFSVAQRLQIHMRTHTGERPFQCPRCPKAFKHKAALNRHDRVHTGAKPYACPQCGKRFSQSNSMKQHCAGVHMKHYLYSRRKLHKDIQ